MNKVSLILVLICSLSMSSLVFAQETPEADGEAPAEVYKGKKKTVRINFEDQLVQGGTEKPEAEYIFEKTQFNYRKFIRLRGDFKPEVQGGMEEMNAGE